jgi:hypothetical protein
MNLGAPVYYQESNQINKPKLAMAYVGSFLVAIVAAYVYMLIVVMLPLVYIGCVMPMIFGVGLSFALRFITRLTHNRNRKSRCILAVVMGLFFTYFQWVIFLMYAHDLRLPGFGTYLANLGLPFSMEGLWAFVVEINEVGLWEIFGEVINGSLLTVIWVLECLIVIVALLLPIMSLRAYPYAEDKEKWYKKYTLEEDYKVGGAIKLTAGLNEDAYKTIKELDYGDGNRHAKIHLYYLEQSKYHYLDVEKVMINNEAKREVDLLIEAIRIDHKTAKSLLDNFEHKQERIEII